MKKCSVCKELKPLDDFSKDKSNSDGYSYTCKNCMKAYRLLKTSKESKKLQDARFQKTIKGKACSVRRRAVMKLNNPEKIQARSRISSLLQHGKLTRPNKCSNCCSDNKIEAHHWSYKKEHWESVVWLCRKCHLGVHAKDK